MRKKGTLTFVTKWMGPEGIVLSEILQAEKDTHCMISLTHEILRKVNLQKQSRTFVTRAWGMGTLGRC